MKALFLIFHGFNEANGISKKIRYQVKALKDCGVDVRLCHYDVTSYGERRWMVDDEVIADFGTGFAAKIWKRVYYSPILDYARREGIDFVYMRSFHNASPFTLRLVKSLKRTGAKVVMEIPTYPYDQEYVTRSMKFHLAIDRCFRHKLAKALDGIVTFSNAEEIFGGNTIRISNGIDFEAIPMKKQQNDTSKELHLIGVAEVHYWHGFDRLVRGLADYYRNNPEYKVYFHIVGPLSGERERAGILPVVRDNHLEPYVLLHGPLHGDELDAMFEKADFAIGSLGRHRSGITYIKTLKNYPDRVLPDRQAVTMDKPFLNAYSRLLIKTCHKRGAFAMGGMAAFIPSKDEEHNNQVLNKVKADKSLEANNGHDGTWIAHPGLADTAMAVFNDILGSRKNQLEVMREQDAPITADQLLAPCDGERTEEGMRANIRVAVQYIEAWISGNGCVPIYGLMEDAATAEISRTSIWQWIHHQKTLSNGKPVTKALFRQMLGEEMKVIASELGEERFSQGRFDDAARLMEQITTSDELIDFLTLPGYRLLA